MIKNHPAIILVDPQMGENIGAAARAMLNFGCGDLKIVRPRDGWPNEAANANAAGALEIIPAPEVFQNVADALKPYTTVYATTARPRDMRKKVFTAQAAAVDIVRRQQNGERTAILFGGERAGLTNDDVALAHHIITVPVNPDFSSINLAQAVLLVTYEYFQAQAEQSPHTHDLPPPAPHEELHSFLNRLEDELEAHHFFRSSGLKPTMTKNIRNMFGRADFSVQEVRTLQGMLSALTGKNITED